jgi:hypothetical protein
VEIDARRSACSANQAGNRGDSRRRSSATSWVRAGSTAARRSVPLQEQLDRFLGFAHHDRPAPAVVRDPHEIGAVERLLSQPPPHVRRRHISRSHIDGEGRDSR